MSLVRRVVPRFSLRTLLLFVLMVGAGGALWLRWEPWQVVLTLRPGGVTVRNARFSDDGRYIVTHSNLEPSHPHARTVLWDRSGRELHRVEWVPNWTSQGYHNAIFLLGSDYLFLRVTSGERSFQLVNLQNFKLLFPKEGVSEVYFSTDYKYCAALLHGFTQTQATVVCHDLRTGEKKAAWDFVPGLNSYTPHIRVSPGGRWVLVATKEGQGYDTVQRLYLCNTTTQEKERVHILDSPIESVSFSSNGSRFVVLTKTTFQVFDTERNRLIMDGRFDACFQYFPTATNYVEFIRDNESYLLKLGGAELVVDELPKALAKHRVGLNGQWLAWQKDGTLTVHDLVTGKEYSTKYDEVDLVVTSDEGDPGKLVFIKYGGPVVDFDLQQHSFRPSLINLSPDSTRWIDDQVKVDRVLRYPSDELASNLQPINGDDFAWSPDSQQFIRTEGENARVYARIRSDEPWNLVWEPALWLAIFFGGGFVWSLWVGVRARGGA